jgi:hypothetical protein
VPGHTLGGWLVFAGAMNHINNKETSNDKLAAARENIKAFGQHYNYDVSYLEELMDASPGAFLAFEGAMGVGRYQKAAPKDLLFIAKITATRAEDCGPCTALGLKMAKEAGIPDAVVRGALKNGKGLSPEQLDVYHYARAVAANEVMDPELLPRLEKRWGREVLAELAVAIVGACVYPTMKRALGHAQSCALIPELAA